jgi:hypothetical protein
MATSFVTASFVLLRFPAHRKNQIYDKGAAYLPKESERRNANGHCIHCGRMIAAMEKPLATRTLIAVTTEASRIAFIVIDSSL